MSKEEKVSDELQKGFKMVNDHSIKLTRLCTW
jgi:hypothetical protein